MSRDDSFRLFSQDTADAVVFWLAVAVLAWAGTTDAGRIIGGLL